MCWHPRALPRYLAVLTISLAGCHLLLPFEPGQTDGRAPADAWFDGDAARPDAARPDVARDVSRDALDWRDAVADVPPVEFVLCKGCLSLANKCVPGYAVSACGTGGVQCSACSTTISCKQATCANGVCGDEDKTDGSKCLNGICHGGKCCKGCWDGNTCMPGAANASCGGGGAACKDCAGTAPVCQTGYCNKLTTQCENLAKANKTPCSVSAAAGKCAKGTCCLGCISGSVCISPVTANSCQTGGNDCYDCTVVEGVCSTASCNSMGGCKYTHLSAMSGQPCAAGTSFCSSGKCL